jgi:hypothetical protein
MLCDLLEFRLGCRDKMPGATLDTGKCTASGSVLLQGDSFGVRPAELITIYDAIIY